MALTILTNQSASAPALSGTVGSLIALLDFCLVTTLGWTKPYSGTNLAAYKQPTGTNGMYLYVDDTVAQNARLSAYEAMTAINAGTGNFPTTTQVAGGGYLFKSATANSTARPWYFASDGKLFHLCVGTDGTTPASFASTVGFYSFGDFISYKSGDAFNTTVCMDTGASSNTSGFTSATSFTTTASGLYVARPHTQIGTSLNASRFTDAAGAGGNGSYLGNGAVPYPSPIDGGINIARIFIGDPASGRRGRLQGAWAWQHLASAINSGDTFNGAGDLTGRTFIFFKNANWPASIVLETSDTWST